MGTPENGKCLFFYKSFGKHNIQIKLLNIENFHFLILGPANHPNLAFLGIFGGTQITPKM